VKDDNSKKRNFSEKDFVRIQRELESGLEGIGKDAEDLAGESLEALMKITVSGCGGIYFVERDTGDLRRISHRCRTGSLMESHDLFRADSEFAALIKRGESVYMNQAELDDIIGVERKGYHASLHSAFIPVTVRDDVIAFIFLGSDDRSGWSEEFRDEIEETVSHMSGALEKIWSKWNLLSRARKYSEIFDNIYQYTAVILPDGRVMDANRLAREFGGRNKEEVRGKKLSEGFIWEHLPGLSERILKSRKRAAAGEFVKFETEIKNSEGKLFHIDFSMRPVKDSSGRVEMIICEGRDITEHVELARALKESEANYHTIFDSVEDAIFIHELTTGRVVDVNCKMIEMYGYSKKEEVLGKRLEKFSSGQYPYCSEYIEEKLSNVQGILPTSMEWHARRKDGSLFWVDVNVKIVRLLGEERMLAVVRDITDKKRVEDELRESEKKYRNIVENSHEAILIIDDNFELVFANSRVMELLGRERDEIIGHSFGEFLDEESARLVTDRYRRRRRGEDVPGRYEFNIIKSSGEKRRVEISASLIRMDGRVLSVALILDITERERAEKRYKTLFESSRDAIMIFRLKNWKFMGANPAALSLFDVGSEDQFNILTPVDLSPSFQPDGVSSADRMKEMIDTAYKEGAHYFEWIQQGKDGREFFSTVFLVRIELGGMECMQMTVRDITRSKEAERELEALRDYLRDIFNSMPSVLIGVNLEGEVTQWNEEAERITGLKTCQARGRKLGEVYPALKDKMNLVREAISSGHSRKDMRAVRHIEGETHYKDVMVYPVHHRGEREAMIREDDITDKVRFEEMIVQSEKMLSLGGFAAGMAHEINNPLAVIIQNASVISNRLTGDMPANRETADEVGIDLDDLREYVNRREINEMTDTIIDFGKRAASVVRGMLSFSRKGEAKKTGADINEIVKEAVELARKDISLDFDNIALETDFEPGLPVIYCERNKMVQALLNIIKNAAEAMKIEESSKSRLHISTCRSDSRVNIRIRDNGHGIDSNTLAHVFEPFYTTKKENGVGLGLSIAYFIITESYAGTIDVKSEEGEWTEFSITLPLE